METTMSNFSVPEMSCGHCTAAIEKSIKALDPAAKVACELDTRTVQVESNLSDSALSDAIRDAGYDVAAPAAR